MENTQPQSQPKAQPKRLTYSPEPVRAAIAPEAGNARRSGLVPLSIGASRMMRGRDGMRRQYQARELRVEAERAQRDGRELAVGVVCFECAHVYANEADFKADHTETSEQYKKNAEVHTFAYWCEDKADPKSQETIAALGAEVKALEKAYASSLTQVSQLDDVDAMIRERKRAEEIKGMVGDARARRRVEEENIIGLLSETE